ncbi:hypothetical protein RRG08_036836 [Elysia crispata]|uniref:Uncharacterized protein n=1 Tax=Elysia crispata TaxID=231223 RepID=A0AAE0Y8I4_9GAST|nr:hypothetical protein RRG08_036836 [Elysia crispata]
MVQTNAETKYSFPGQAEHFDRFKKDRSSDIPSVEKTTLKNLEPLGADADKYPELIEMCDQKIIPVAHHDDFRGLPRRP